MKLKLRFIIAAFIALVIYIPVVHGQANLTFSGGNGTPLSTTLQNAVTYTITNSNCSANVNGPFFVFQGVGAFLSNSQPSVTGTINYSVNSGTSQPITTENSGVTLNDVSANDVYVYGNLFGIPNASTVVLSAGTVTTNTNVAAAPPTNGNYTTFITNGSGVRCSSNGVVAPPTAAPVSISGRVLTSSRRGLANAFVYLTDQNGNIQVRITNPFGYYRFEDVQAGQTVTVTVVSKRFRFAPQVLNINEEVILMNLVAEN